MTLVVVALLDLSVVDDENPSADNIRLSDLCDSRERAQLHSADKVTEEV
jgi:hypothetical protein